MGYPADEPALSNAVEYIYGSGVPGDIIEFGCLAGRSAAVLARAMTAVEKSYGKRSDVAHGIRERRLWLFDSFQGWPPMSSPIDTKSPHVVAKVWQPGEPRGGTPDGVRRMCAPYIGDRVSVVPGWFKDTLIQLSDELRFALVHVDCDIYSSTIDVLNHLFSNDMLSDGCTILFDNWYCNRGSPRFGEQKAWADAWDTTGDWIDGFTFSDWGAYGVASRRFIVHRNDA